MTAPAKAPARRLLATYPTEAEAVARAAYWKRMEGEDADVQVEWGVKGTTPDRPWAVTAAKTGGHP
jgi:hypothetical protein